jgi:hypothetical protein
MSFGEESALAEGDVSMLREIVRTIAVIAVWLVTFCILFFGGFTFTGWGEEASKNLLGIGLFVAASVLSAVIILWRPRGSS